MKNIYLVVPTIRDLHFFTEWGTAFEQCHLLVIQDGPEVTVQLPHSHFKSVRLFDWADIRNDFGEEEWIFSRKNAGIRSYGFYKAWELGADIVLTLDDDCFPVEANFVQKHFNNLNYRGSQRWMGTYPDPDWQCTRGFPYEVREKIPTVVSHGLWSGALDLDAYTEVKLPQLLAEKAYPSIRQTIPTGYYFPMCSMNYAFTREVIPLMFYPMMGHDPQGNAWGYDRYDDIWAGIFVKKITDHLRLGIVNGSPFVEHRKASEPGANLTKEATGMKMNEILWKRIDTVNLTQTTIAGCYRELAEKTDWPPERYFKQLKQAMLLWIAHFE